ncbi:hypothetical protein MMC26_001579 [Xylographa opegraphella]|nr:hypothetical protein [Xylographa opegraphella]
MADRGRDPRELVFCHQCENEWFRDEHGLECPRCHSEIVEIIEADNDPRDNELSQPPPPSEPPNPLLTHNPWDQGAPDPDEGDISEVQWSGPGGMHFTRISVRSGHGRRDGPPMENFPALFSAMLGDPPNGDTRRREGIPPLAGSFRSPADNGGLRSPLQEGPSRQGFSTFHTTRLFPRDANSPQPQGLPVDDLSGILTTLLQGLHGAVVNVPAGGAAAPTSPLTILHQLLNPANARSGDAVYTQEALDRVITQLMEQHSTSTAPGPASESAISSLPKVKLAESQLDSNGKAECSICMDSLSVGDEVTELPCKHWFHEDCVGAWLREHDTCPQCRRGIMPKDGDGRAPRSPGQMPMNMQTPWGGGYFSGLQNMMATGRGTAEAGDSGSGSQQEPYRVRESPTPGPAESSSGPSRPHPGSRRTSSHSQHSGRTNGGGISGWMGRHFGNGSGSR